jgi:Rrf2 family protein
MCIIPVVQMGEGVEWGLHCCVTLGWLRDEGPVSIRKLAAWFDLPQEYLKKRLQALTKAGILASTPGARGGFSLARPPEQITMMDVVTALEGAAEAFRCVEIRQRRRRGGRAVPPPLRDLHGDAAGRAGLAPGAGPADDRRPHGRRGPLG